MSRYLRGPQEEGKESATRRKISPGSGHSECEDPDMGACVEEEEGGQRGCSGRKWELTSKR